MAEKKLLDKRSNAALLAIAFACVFLLVVSECSPMYQWSNESNINIYKKETRKLTISIVG